MFNKHKQRILTKYESKNTENQPESNTKAHPTKEQKQKNSENPKNPSRPTLIERSAKNTQFAEYQILSFCHPLVFYRLRSLLSSPRPTFPQSPPSRHFPRFESPQASTTNRGQNTISRSPQNIIFDDPLTPNAF